MRTDAKQIQLIHIGKNQLGWDRATYEACLSDVAGRPCASSKDLSHPQREQVLAQMQAKGFKIKSKAGRNFPAARKARLIKKIQAQLISLGNLPEAYADGIAKRMFGVEVYQWLDEDDLRKLVAALSYQQQRKDAPMG